MDEPILTRHHLHVPVRHPRQVAASWARRGKNLDRLLLAYESMFGHLDHSTCYRIEDYPVLDGGDDWDREAHGESKVADYIAQVERSVISPHRAWFSNYYEDI
jgi:hypothetical protein